MKPYFESLDFLLLLLAATAGLISFWIYILRAKFVQWRAYASIANALAFYAVLLMIQFGNDPRGHLLEASACAILFLLIANTRDSA